MTQNELFAALNIPHCKNCNRPPLIKNECQNCFIKRMAYEATNFMEYTEII